MLRWVARRERTEAIVADSIPYLLSRVRERFRCEAVFVEAVEVVEPRPGLTEPWRANVHVFDLLDHPMARRCYAWIGEGAHGKRSFAAFLHEAPEDNPVEARVDGPVAAHRAWIEAVYQETMKGEAEWRRQRDEGLAERLRTSALPAPKGVFVDLRGPRLGGSRGY